MNDMGMHGLPWKKCQDGTDGYVRCYECREAHRRHMRVRRERRQGLLAADPSIRPHGSLTTYNAWGCRCDPCKAAALASRKLYGRNSPSYLPVRRQQAIPFGREWVDDRADTGGT